MFEGYKWIYIYFTDLAGVFRRVLVNASLLDEEAIREGIGKLDGSSVRGFTSIDESDLLLRPDPSTILPYPWCGALCEDGVGRVIADVYQRMGGGRLPQDPRYAAQRTMEVLAERGWSALMGAELEYFVFDEFEVVLNPWALGYRVGVERAYWSQDAAYRTLKKDGYYTPAPSDAAEEMKYELIRILAEEYKIRVEVSHHEVAGASQHEINFQPGTPLETADRIQLIKEAVRVVADENGMQATFMPKPITGENGSGLHVHVSLWKDYTNLFYDESDQYAGLSQTARYFIGGLIEHGRALSAIVSPTVNSYRRLMPGYEAPVYLVWSRANRSAAIRVPLYHKKPRSSRIEYRSPDPSANPYLALSAIVLAGLDGVIRKIEPGDPVDENVYAMTPERRRQLGIRQLPRSLDEALDELETDHDWLLRAWPREMLETYIEMKRDEARRVNEWVSPAEVYYYAGV